MLIPKICMHFWIPMNDCGKWDLKFYPLHIFHYRPVTSDVWNLFSDSRRMPDNLSALAAKIRMNSLKFLLLYIQNTLRMSTCHPVSKEQLTQTWDLLRFEAVPLDDGLPRLRDHVLPVFRLRRSGAIFTWKCKIQKL